MSRRRDVVNRLRSREARRTREKLERRRRHSWEFKDDPKNVLIQYIGNESLLGPYITEPVKDPTLNQEIRFFRQLSWLF